MPNIIAIDKILFLWYYNMNIKLRYYGRFCLLTEIEVKLCIKNSSKEQ